MARLVAVVLWWCAWTVERDLDGDGVEDAAAEGDCCINLATGSTSPIPLAEHMIAPYPGGGLHASGGANCCSRCAGL